MFIGFLVFQRNLIGTVVCEHKLDTLVYSVEKKLSLCKGSKEERCFMLQNNVMKQKEKKKEKSIIWNKVSKTLKTERQTLYFFPNLSSMLASLHIIVAAERKVANYL